MFKLANYFTKMTEAADGDTGGAGGAPNSLIDTPPPAGGGQDAPQQDGNDNTPPNQDGQPPANGNTPPAAGERPEWLPEKFGSGEDLAKSYTELESKLGAFTGAPETGEYQLTLGEGQDNFEFYEHESNDIKAFMGIAKEMNMSQESFDRVLQFYVDSKITQDHAELVQRQQATLDYIGGAKELETISAKAKATLSEDQYKLLQHATSTAPDAAGAAIALVNQLALGGQQQPITGFQHAAPVKTKGELQEMMKDKRYKSDPEYRAEILKGFEALAKQQN
ncbi:scaffolding protein [Vibrio phage CKB-S2]|nr:scaffolding protein [Vibrio phage CKB-S2]